MGLVESVNVSGVKAVAQRNTTVTTGIFKVPVAGRVPLRGVNLRGDDQADRSVHGGPERAVYAYAGEDYDWWEQQLSRVLRPGLFGENLTVRGIDISAMLIGEEFRIGTTVLRATSPRVPCYKLAMAMDDPAFIKQFAQALRPGAYFAVVEEGDIAAGDPVELVRRPSHDLTIAEMARIFLFERDRLRDLLRAPELPDSWREWVIEHSG
jgi:MOSC domain-containing protein YiiM